MADFRTKLITLAGMATVFAGMAFGQAGYATVNPTTGVNANAVFLRAEGTTENVAPSTVTVVMAAVAPLAAQVNLTAYLTPALTITSQIVSKTSETTAVATCAPLPCDGVGADPAKIPTVNGVASGSSVSFNGITIPANAGTVTITISGIRVNASTIASGNGVPTGVGETFFVGGTNITPVVPNPVTVGYALNGLGAVTSGSVTSANSICLGAAVTAVSYNTIINEGFATSFKTAADESIDATAATNGTRITLTFANVAANTSVYVPLLVQATNGAVLTAVTSATGKFAAAGDAGLKTEPTPPTVYLPFAGQLAINAQTNGIAAVTIASGTGTVYYEVTTDVLGSVDVYTIPVYLANTAGTLTAPASAMTSTVSFAPIGSSTNYPSFVSGTSTATVTGSAFGACNTTLLFPYVTNASGFETGIALANTSLDALGSKGASIAATQAGTCALSFYGNATASSNPATYTTASIASGTTAAFTLTSAAGAGFTGYIIANCNFQYAHAFSYIVYNFGTTSGTAMGYLAEVLGGSTPTSRAGGAPESLNN
jgi:hypothetical protein